MLWLDRSEWQSFERGIINADNNRNYIQAINKIDNYQEPLSLLPDFLRVDRIGRLKELSAQV